MTFATKNKELLDLFRLSGMPVPHEDSNMGRAADYLAHVGFATLALLVIFHPF